MAALLKACQIHSLVLFKIARGDGRRVLLPLPAIFDGGEQRFCVLRARREEMDMADDDGRIRTGLSLILTSEHANSVGSVDFIHYVLPNGTQT